MGGVRVCEGGVVTQEGLKVTYPAGPALNADSAVALALEDVRSL